MSDSDYSVLLSEALKQLKEEFLGKNKEQEFAMWLGRLGFISAADNTIVLSVPSTWFRDTLNERGHAKTLKEKIESLLGSEIKLEYQIQERAAQSEKKAVASEPSAFRPVKNEITQKEKHPQLNENFTFDSFIPGDRNAFTYNTALAISKNPGRAYNPLLIYGGIGLGKTHLMHAIGNVIYQNAGGKVIYISAENFLNEFTESIKSKTAQKFTNKYRSADVFLLDDIQFIKEKTGLQENIFYTFEALYNAQKQLVFASDRHISELKGVDERLVSRFAQGISANLLFPTIETRIAIIEKKLELSGQTLPKEVIELIATRVETNVRDLESCLKTLFAYADLIKKDITLEIAEEQLRDKFRSPHSDSITIEKIQKIVANYYNISFSDIKGKKQKRSVTIPRHIAIYIARHLTEFSYAEIGQEFGGRHYTSMMHAVEKIEETLHNDSSLDSTIQILERLIKEKN
jgi:chromosomal replication initiator protein